MFEQIFIAVVAAVALFIGWWWVWIPVVCLYAWYYDWWWMVVLAVLVDGYYGAFASLPVLSIATLVLVVITTTVRPLIFTYD